MSDLKSQLMKAREFDVDWLDEEAETVEPAGDSMSYRIGFKDCHAKDQRLFELLIDVAVAANELSEMLRGRTGLEDELDALKSFLAEAGK